MKMKEELTKLKNYFLDIKLNLLNFIMKLNKDYIIIK